MNEVRKFNDERVAREWKPAPRGTAAYEEWLGALRQAAGGDGPMVWALETLADFGYLDPEARRKAREGIYFYGPKGFIDRGYWQGVTGVLVLADELMERQGGVLEEEQRLSAKRTLWSIYNTMATGPKGLDTTALEVIVGYGVFETAVEAIRLADQQTLLQLPAA